MAYYDPRTWQSIADDQIMYSNDDPNTGVVGGYYYQAPDGNIRKAAVGDANNLDAYLNSWDSNYNKSFGSSKDILSTLAKQNNWTPQQMQGAYNSFLSSRGLDPYSDSNQTGYGVSQGWYGPQLALQGVLQGLGRQDLIQQYLPNGTEAQQKQIGDQGTNAQNSHWSDVEDFTNVLAGLASVLGAGYGLNSLYGVGGLGAEAGAGAAGGWTSGFDLPMGDWGGAFGTGSGINGAGWTPDEWSSVLGNSSNGSSISQAVNQAVTNPFEQYVNGGLGSEFGTTSAGGPLANGTMGNLANGTLQQNLASLMGSGNGISTPFGNIGLKDILSTGFNLLNNNRLSGNLSDAANRAASLSDPSQRPGSQQAFATAMDYVNNPSKYYNNQGKATADLIMQGVPSAIAKSGNWGNVVANAGTNIAGALSQNYNGFLSNLFGQTGLNQGTGGAGSVYGSLAGPAAGADSAGYAGLGSLLGKTLPDFFSKNMFSSGSNSGGLGQNPFGTIFS